MRLEVKFLPKFVCEEFSPARPFTPVWTAAHTPCSHEAMIVNFTVHANFQSGFRAECFMLRYPSVCLMKPGVIHSAGAFAKVRKSKSGFLPAESCSQGELSAGKVESNLAVTLGPWQRNS
ncbi:hypothetical protein RRG08_040009 [Elysia crispata]|uniref:Uncharacterized protein n=1 Tax=Elysia crispata TaxID=231223 RepID=A0AAE1DCJ2_9GAST|nr:hypothetical protein RRG08_040009 [Elysia crispata]